MRFIAVAPLASVLLLATTCHGTGIFELYNAETNAKMVDIVDGGEIPVDPDAPLSIQVRFPGSRVTSVKFGLDSNPNHQMENTAPFFLCGNRGTDSFPCPELGLGSHTVTATPYKSRRLAGTVAKVTFTIVASRPTLKPTIPLPPADVPPPMSGPMAPLPLTKPSTRPVPAPTLIPCRNKTTCLDCLGSQCYWSDAGLCSEFACVDILCYTRTGVWGNPNSFNSTAAVCSQYDRDQVDKPTCRTPANCSSCTSTIRTDGVSKCRWWTSSNSNFSRCGIEGCFFDGCSSVSCPAVPPAVAPPPPIPKSGPVAPSPPSVIQPPSPPVPAPTQSCSSNKNCLDCLGSQCYWSQGRCSEFCTVDSVCYSRSGIAGNPNSFNSTTAVCAQYDRDRVDQETCRTPTNCASCTSTIRTDGVSKCGWYTASNSNFSFCGIGNCIFSGCIKQLSCPAVPPAVAPPPISKSGPVAPVAPSVIQPPSPPAPAPTQSCRNKTTCLDCLGSQCYWSDAGRCSEFACVDTLCYTRTGVWGNPNSFNSTTAVCSQYDRDQVDKPTCRTPTNCSSCTSTIRTDGVSKCRWWTSSNSNFSRCGIEGCFFSECSRASCPV